MSTFDTSDFGELVSVWDSPDDGYAFNLYVSDDGVVTKVDVWNNPGATRIALDGSITRIDGREGVT